MNNAADTPIQTVRAIHSLGPVVGKPLQGSRVPAHLNVPAIDQRLKLLGVLKQPPTDRRQLEASRSAVSPGQADEVGNGVHAPCIGNFTAPVNGYLTATSDHADRSDYRIMLEDIVHRVEARLQAQGLTARAASKAAGLSEDAIRNLQRAAREGKRQGVSTRTLNALAPVLGTNVNWLLNGEGDDEANEASDTVAVVGLVGAGSVATLYSEGQGPFDHVDAPHDATDSTVALSIRGISLGPAFDEGIVFYDDVRSPVTEDLHGRLCIVGLEDGRVLIKILRSANDGTYHLFSNTVEEPLLNERVAWAARVKEVRPR